MTATETRNVIESFGTKDVQGRATAWLVFGMSTYCEPHSTMLKHVVERASKHGASESTGDFLVETLMDAAWGSCGIDMVFRDFAITNIVPVVDWSKACRAAWDQHPDCK